jgi:hypothetical protein
LGDETEMKLQFIFKSVLKDLFSDF